MPNFTGFNTNYAPMVHTDQDGTPIEQEKKHSLSQGWLQMFTVLNQILTGRWERPKVSSEASVNKCSITPYSATVYLEYASDIPSITLKFPVACYGILSIYNSSNILVSNIKISGNEITIPNITAGAVVVGTLSV